MDELLLVFQNETIENAIQYYMTHLSVTTYTTIIRFLSSSHPRVELFEFLVKRFQLIQHDFDNLLCLACIHRHREIVKWILIHGNPSILGYNRAYGELCERNDLEMIQYLFDLCPSTNIFSHSHKDCFQRACLRGNLSLSKWIFNIEPALPLSRILPNLFRSCYFNYNWPVTHWLYSLALTHNITVEMNADMTKHLLGV